MGFKINRHHTLWNWLSYFSFLMKLHRNERQVGRVIILQEITIDETIVETENIFLEKYECQNGHTFSVYDFENIPLSNIGICPDCVFELAKKLGATLTKVE